LFHTAKITILTEALQAANKPKIELQKHGPLSAFLTMQQSLWIYAAHVENQQQTLKSQCNFRLPPPSRWELHSCGPLHSE